MISQTALLVSKNLKLQVPAAAHDARIAGPPPPAPTARPPTLTHHPSHCATTLRYNTPSAPRRKSRSVVATATQLLIGIIFLTLIAVMQFSLENSGAVRRPRSTLGFCQMSP